jgi:hypothetical protein
LRWATQAEQNTNRVNRTDKLLPPDELQAYDIKEYPRHIRYDRSQNRFLIEKHPNLQKKQWNGTRKGSILERYYDILKKLETLESTEPICNTTDPVMNELKECLRTFNGGICCIQGKQNTTCMKQLEHLDQILNVTTTTNITHGSSSERIMVDETNEHQEGCDTEKQNATNATIVYNGDIVAREDDFIVYREMIPRYTYFCKPTDKRGCSFKIDKHPDLHDKRQWSTTSSRSVSLKNKYEALQAKLTSLQQ